MNYLFYCLLIAFAICNKCNSQVISKGKCPEVKTVGNFTLKPYLGDWYEIYKFNAGFENGQSCIHANYQLKSDGHIRVYNRGQTKTGNISSAIGDGYTPDPKTPGRLAVKFSPIAPYGKYWVLDTDYTSYSLVYSCSDLFSISHVEFAWILSRQRTLEKATVDRLFATMKSYNIDTDNFIQEVQTNCMD